MPINRGNIVQFASDPDTSLLFQTFTQIANFVDGLETAAGVQVGATKSNSAAAPAAAAVAIGASNGHFFVTITNPSASGTAAPIQHQVESSTDLNFDVNSSVATFTLGLGQLTVDIVDPNVLKYFRFRSRTSGSAWNPWTTYANASGVVALNAGPLKTS